MADPGRWWRVPWVVAVVVVAWVGWSAAHAGFTSSGTASHTLSSATLEPPSNLSVSTRCGPLLSLSAAADLSWTATPSTFAGGYRVERWLGAVLQSTTAVSPRTATTLTQTSLLTGTSYTWKVSATTAAWTSSQVSVSGTTPGLCL